MNDESATIPARAAAWPAQPAISIVSPTYNEAANIRPLVAAVGEAMAGTSWELIIVDDDSPDGTSGEALALMREGWPVRCIRRIGRRGLASAVVEGMLAASGEVLAVIDADMQHDERVLLRMLELLRATDADVVVGTRYAGEGGVGEWNRSRRLMSRLATRSSRLLVGAEVSDPMSGFFALRRSVFEASVYNLSQRGYKILLDILTSAPDALKIVEVPYVFRNRRAGESKLDASIVSEYAFLLIDKLSHGLVPPKFVLFCLIGGLGLGVHLTVLQTMGELGFAFTPAQAAATLVAMAFNFLINNSVTYRREGLRGWAMVRGGVLFCLACSIGAVANMGVASLAIAHAGSWPLAGIAGAMMSAAFNFGVASRIVWTGKGRTAGRRRSARAIASGSALQAVPEPGSV